VLQCLKKCIYFNRDVYTSKETYIQKRPTKETPKRDLIKKIHVWQKNACISKETHKRDLYTSKETCAHQKRPLHIKRDLYTSKETNVPQKRPMLIKRDQLIRRPTDNIRRDLQKRQKKVTSV